MPVNPFFNLYKNKKEQSLVEDLINESININGFDGYYIPNSDAEQFDFLYGDDPIKQFDDAFVVTAYLSNSVDPGMNNDFFSKFGLEIKNNVRIQITRREFEKKVQLESHTRPKEGDLFYIPFASGTGELYEIKYVNDSTDSFTLGRKQPYYWELELELFKYSNENIDTGIEEIDIVDEVDNYAIEYILGSGSGNYEKNEVIYQGSNLSSANCTGIVQNWNAPNKILKVTNISGVFANNVEIIGNTSDAHYVLNQYDPLDNPQIREDWDNKVIQTEEDLIIDNSEENPFGTL